MGEVIMEIGSDLYKVVVSGDTFLLMDVRTGRKTVGEFCKKHTPEQHDIMAKHEIMC